MAGHPARGSVGGSRHSSLAPGAQAGVGPVGPGPLLVSGCTDGSMFVWEDRASTGLLSEAEGVWLRHPLQKGERPGHWAGASGWGRLVQLGASQRC